MNCIEVQDLLSAYIDNQCTTQEESMLKEHLDNCSACLEEYKMIAAIVNMTHQIEEVDLPEDFHSDLMNRIHNQFDQIPRKKPFYKRVYGSSIVAAALLFFVVFGVIGTNMLMNMSKQENAIKEETVVEDAREEITNNTIYNTTDYEATSEEAPREGFSSNSNEILEEAKKDSAFINPSALNENTEADQNIFDDSTVDRNATDTNNEQNALILNTQETTEPITEKNKENTIPQVASKMAPDNTQSRDPNISYDEAIIAGNSDSQEMELSNVTGEDTISDDKNDQTDTLSKALKWIALALLLMITIPIGVKLVKKGRN